MNGLCLLVLSQLTFPLVRLAREGHAGVVALRERVRLDCEQPYLEPCGLDRVGSVFLALVVAAVLLIAIDPRLGLPLAVALCGWRSSAVSNFIKRVYGATLVRICSSFRRTRLPHCHPTNDPINCIVDGELAHQVQGGYRGIRSVRGTGYGVRGTV